MRNRRQKRVEARVFDESGPLVAVWFNQPWIARELERGHARAAPRQAAPAQPVLGEEPRAARQRERARPHARPRAGPSGDQGHHAGAIARARRARRARSCARRWSRCRRACASRRACRSGPAVLDAVHFPESEDDEQGARRRLAFEELFLLQLAVAGRRRARREGRKARPLAARGVVVDRWRWSLPFELTGDQVSAMAEIDADLAPRAADAAAADGGGGKRQDCGRAGRHAPRRRERRPGRVHGAHRDARRAAPPHARLAARRAHAGGAAHRLHDRGAPARAARPARERSSSSWWWARTR